MKSRLRDVGAAGAGSALTSAVASACCVPVAGPLIVGLFGASGSVLAASLKPYSPYTLGGSLLLLVYGFWSSYRPREACATDAKALKDGTRGLRWSRIILWAAAGIWLAALQLNLLLPGG